MTGDAEDPKATFSRHDGREVFDNGGVKLWRCPECAWWRDWSEPRCCACGLKRDGAVRYRAAGSGS